MCERLLPTMIGIGPYTDWARVSSRVVAPRVQTAILSPDPQHCRQPTAVESWSRNCNSTSSCHLSSHHQEASQVCFAMIGCCAMRGQVAACGVHDDHRWHACNRQIGLG